ncbi:hypothetical protein DEI82_09475 [Curtobacterium sp. MCBD17_019]|nr:hypothetical protein DEI82_09475 [Curtobacterium sp. MCBD17_019]
MHDAMPDEDGPSERVVARIRPSGRQLVRPVVALLVAAAGYGSGHGVFHAQWAWVDLVVSVAALVVLVLGALVPFLRWLSTRFVVTTHRLVAHEGVLMRHRTEVVLTPSLVVSVHRSIGQRLCGSGDVVVQGASDRPVLFWDVPGVALVAAAVQELAGRAAPPPAAHATGPTWEEILRGPGSDDVGPGGARP